MKFDMGQAWSEAMAMIAGNREVLLVVAGIFFFLPAMLLAFNMPDLESMALERPEQLQAAMLQFYAQAWWVLLLVSLTSVAGYLTLLTLLRDSSRPTVGQAIKAGLLGLLPAIGTYLLFMIGGTLALVVLVGLLAVAAGSAAATLGLLVWLVGFIYMAVKASLSAPVIAIERTYNPVAVLSRSWKLTKGNSLRLLGFGALLFVAYMVIAAVLQLALNGFKLALADSAFQVINAVVSGVLSTVVAVISVALLAAVHRQLAGETPAALGETFE